MPSSYPWKVERNIYIYIYVYIYIYIYRERVNKSNSESRGGWLEIAMICQELQKKGPSCHQGKYMS